ncbi:MAG: T9SS type A sorting domain-containing protein [Saprospiraceae bacterium]
MKRFIFFGILLLWNISSRSQNLIINPSFERNGKPFCDYWYTVCGDEFKDQCDSFGLCGTRIIKATTPDTTTGKWGVEVRGSFPESASAITYISGHSGTYIYQLKFWMNTEHFEGEVYLGPMTNRNFTDYNLLTDFSQPWTQYILLDTITTQLSDTVGVVLSAGIGDFCLCDVEYDQIELTIIDSLSTGVHEPSQQLYTIYPNPFEDQLNIHFPRSNGFSLTIFDAMGRLINAETTPTEIGQIEMSSVPAGIYSYQIIPSGEPFQTYYGRLIKP